MTVPAGPAWVEEHLRRLQASGIQPHFQLTGIHALETLERLVRKGVYNGPLNLTWIGIGGGFDGPNPFNFLNFVHRAPDGCTLTAESLLKNVLPFNMMAMAMGLHPRCGIEDTIIDQHGERITRCSRSSRWCAWHANWAARSPPARRRGRSTGSACGTRRDETLAANGMAPNRPTGMKNVPLRAA